MPLVLDFTNWPLSFMPPLSPPPLLDPEKEKRTEGARKTVRRPPLAPQPPATQLSLEAASTNTQHPREDPPIPLPTRSTRRRVRKLPAADFALPTDESDEEDPQYIPSPAPKRGRGRGRGRPGGPKPMLPAPRRPRDDTGRYIARNGPKRLADMAPPAETTQAATLEREDTSQRGNNSATADELLERARQQNDTNGHAARDTLIPETGAEMDFDPAPATPRAYSPSTNRQHPHDSTHDSPTETHASSSNARLQHAAETAFEENTVVGAVNGIALALDIPNAPRRSYTQTITCSIVGDWDPANAGLSARGAVVKIPSPAARATKPLRYTCPFCSHLIYCLRLFRLHIKSVHNALCLKVFICSECAEEFSQARAAREHERTHGSAPGPQEPRGPPPRQYNESSDTTHSEDSSDELRANARSNSLPSLPAIENTAPRLDRAGLDAIQELISCRTRTPEQDLSGTQCLQQPSRAPRPTHMAGPELRHLYSVSRKRALRHITQEGPITHCEIEPTELCKYFQTIPEINPQRVLELTPQNVITEAQSRDLLRPFDEYDVSSRLRRVNKDSAPGLSGISFESLSSPEQIKSMVSLFNSILVSGLVPSEWKRSRLTLIHKGGPPKLPSSWRPIAMPDCISKIFFGILAERLLPIARNSELTSTSQKAFLGTDGCAECNLTLDLAKELARRSKSKLFILWVDLKNAFGRVHHKLLLDVLARMGVPAELLAILLDLYSGGVLMYSNSTGNHEIHERVGLRQGDPLSPLLFDVFSTVFLNSVPRDHGICVPEGLRISCTAFADDTALLDNCFQHIQLSAACFEKSATAAGMQIQSEKCSFLAVNFGNVARDKSIRCNIWFGGQDLESLPCDANTRYLGRPYGLYESTDFPNYLTETTDLSRLIFHSDLGPAQKLDALQSFVRPKLLHLMRSSYGSNKDFSKLDGEMRKQIKRICGIPVSATSGYLTGSKEMGCLGFPSLLDMRSAALISLLVNLLNSTTIETKTITRRGLMEATKSGNLTDALTQFQLNDDNTALSNYRSTKSRSYWRRYWRSLTLITSKVNLYLRVHSGNVEVWAGDLGTDAQRIPPDSLYHEILGRLQYADWRELTTHYNGHALAAVALDPASSFFVRSGKNLSFAEWRFAHSARLGVAHHMLGDSFTPDGKHCRRCGIYAENISHVLTLCPKRTSPYVRRHDAILARLIDATIESQPLSDDERGVAKEAFRANPNNPSISLKPGLALIINTEPIKTDKLRKPDFTLINSITKSVIIIDVTVSLEHDADSLMSARQYKIDKYAPIAAVFRRRGFDVLLDALVVGARGSWDPLNGRALRALWLSKRQIKYLSRECVLEAIRWGHFLVSTHSFPLAPNQPGAPARPALGFIDRPGTEPRDEPLQPPPAASALRTIAIAADLLRAHNEANPSSSINPFLWVRRREPAGRPGESTSQRVASASTVSRVTPR